MKFFVCFYISEHQQLKELWLNTNSVQPKFYQQDSLEHLNALQKLLTQITDIENMH